MRQQSNIAHIYAQPLFEKPDCSMNISAPIFFPDDRKIYREQRTFVNFTLVTSLEKLMERFVRKNQGGKLRYLFEFRSTLSHCSKDLD